MRRAVLLTFAVPLLLFLPYTLVLGADETSGDIGTALDTLTIVFGVVALLTIFAALRSDIYPSFFEHMPKVIADQPPTGLPLTSHRPPTDLPPTLR